MSLSMLFNSKRGNCLLDIKEKKHFMIRLMNMKHCNVSLK